MNTIIDGYNLIFRLGWQGRAQHSLALERARNRLIRELASRIPRSSRGDITIVFDAKTTPIKATINDALADGFRVIFAANHDEADTLIEELIASHSAPKSLTVVSDDHRLQSAARRRKAIVSGCEEWLDQLEPLADSATRFTDQESPKDQAIRQLEQTDWLAEFQVDSDEFLSDPKKPEDHPFPPEFEQFGE